MHGGGVCELLFSFTVGGLSVRLYSGADAGAFWMRSIARSGQFNAALRTIASSDGSTSASTVLA